jgi:hypothetical protein
MPPLVLLVPGGPVAPEAKQLIPVIVEAAAVRLTAIITFDHTTS